MSNPQDNLFVTFYTDAIELKAQSEKEGRPIYKDVPFIRIIVPGDMNNVIERVADDNDKARFRQAWEKYERSESQAAEGTPLDQWPQITRSLLKECKYFEIHTVEALSALSDSHVTRMGMGYQELRNKAKVWLDAAKGTSDITAQAAENAQLRQMLADLQEQIKDISATKTRKQKETIE